MEYFSMGTKTFEKTTECFVGDFAFDGSSLYC